MKIGLIVDRLDYNAHGLGNYVYSLTKNILKIDKEKDYVLIHTEDKNYENPYHDVFNEAEELIIKPPGFLPSSIKPTFTKYLLFPRRLKNEKFDLIHEMSQGKVMRFIPELKVITIHDLVFPPKIVKDKLGASNIPYPIKITRSINYHILKNISKKEIHVLCVSNSTKKDVIKYFKVPERRLSVIYEGVDQGTYKPLPLDDGIIKRYNLPMETKKILYAGSEEPRKNVPTLIEAFYKLKKNYNNVVLIKIGASKWWGAREENLKLIKDLNLQNDVIFLDHMPDEDMPKFYNLSDVFVFPSLHEGFGLPPLEAMSCGCPVITSNASSLPEVVGDAGIMVNPRYVNDLANAMFDVLTNDGLKRDMIKKGLERAKIFSWENAARETINIYNDVNK